MKKIFLTATFIGFLGAIGLLILTIRIMGDKSCKIEIQNGGDKELILKTFTITKDYRNKQILVVDSVNLGQRDKIEIGRCVGCSSLDTMDIDFDAVGILDETRTVKLLNRKELVDYLLTKEKIDCATYLIR